MHFSSAAIILNPRSGRGTGQRYLAPLKKMLEEEAVRQNPGQPKPDFQVFATETPGLALRTGEFFPGSASDLARKAIDQGADLIIAAGGDGTVSEVVNGMAGSDCPLAIMPLGTGNDVARTIGLGASPSRAIRAIFEGEPKPTDLGRVAKGFFLNAASVGFDAQVAKAVNERANYAVGAVAYLSAVFHSLSRMKASSLEIEVDGVVYREKGILCAVANNNAYGGGMKIAPKAKMDDGLLDVILVKDASLFEVLTTMPRLFQGTHLSHPKVASWQGKEVSVTADPPILAQADGEMIGETPIQCSMAPGALRLIHPKGPGPA